MFAAFAVVAFIIALAVGTHDIGQPTFWFLVGLILVALHLVCVHFVAAYNRNRQG